MEYSCVELNDLPDEILMINQITTLFITINNNNDDYGQMLFSVSNICDDIFTVFTCLITLVLYESSYKNRVRLNFDDPLLPNFLSWTLLKLKINQVSCTTKTSMLSNNKTVYFLRRFTNAKVFFSLHMITMKQSSHFSIKCQIKKNWVCVL